MALEPGRRFGAYEIVSAIGAGGMGEVYRARDTKLHRDVALKILPDIFLLDPDRLARFDREAQVLASLNHPNIAVIYGLEEADGRKALALELVEGQTLAERIEHGSIPMDEALPVARQIVDALETAHAAGVVHRDLKPANIKLRPDGTIKVLDFGLAKLTQAADPGSYTAVPELTASPTITSPTMVTGVGAILGMAAYMAPEQARGRAVDKRADIWAFGCVLFEMLTGRRAFGGDDVTDTIAAVVRAEPEWNALPSSTPSSIQRLLRRCLRKDPRERLPDIGVARLDIKDAQAEPETAVSRPAIARRRRESLLWLAAGVVIAAIVGIFAARYVITPATDAALEMSVDINTPPTTDSMSFAVSPDGRRLVFVGADGDTQPRLWLRPVNSVSAQALAGTEGATYPFWSPDSRSVAFFAASRLMRLDLGGGPPQVLAEVNPGRGASWSGNGIILLAPRNIGPIVRVSATGGEMSPVTKLEPRQGSHRFPEFLPDGRRFLFYSQGATPDVGGIYLGSLDSPSIKRLTPADSKGPYLEPGWVVFVRQGTLVARRFDPDQEELTGDPIAIADPVAFDGSMNSAAFSVSRTGLVAYRGGGSNRRQLTWFDRAGKTLGTIAGPDETGLLSPEISPDGRRVGVHRTEQGNTDVWILDTLRSTRFTYDLWIVPLAGDRKSFAFLNSPFEDRIGQFSPDVRWIAYVSNQSGRHEIYVRPFPARDGQWQISTAGGISPRWSPDGKELFYIAPDGRLMTTPVTVNGDTFEPGTPVALFQTQIWGGGTENYNRVQYDVAPDGRFLINATTEEASAPITLLLNWNPERGN